MVTLFKWTSSETRAAREEHEQGIEKWKRTSKMTNHITLLGCMAYTPMKSERQWLHSLRT